MVKDVLHYRKAIENLIEDARSNKIEIMLERNIFKDVDIVVINTKTTEKCRIRKLQLGA